MGAGDPILNMTGVRFTWPGRQDFRLSVPELVIAKGERLLLTGPSGTGKSTLLSLITGIVTPQAGAITIAGAEIAQLKGATRDRFRANHFGIIFQMFNLLPYGSIIDNVILPLRFAAQRRARVEAQGPLEAEAKRLLLSLKIPPELIAKTGVRASDLSVGQQQRVAAARALIGAPDLIIADEPTSALDADSQTAFLERLFSDVTASNSTLIMVSHDERLSPLFQRIVRLADIAHIERGDSL